MAAAESDDDFETSSSFSGSDTERPNRWEGPSSTWQDLNREEINTLTALNEIRNRDLAVHLYNAFALKQRHRVPGPDRGPLPDQDINATTGQKVQSDDWLPQRSWTAWPMCRERVPPDEFMRRVENDEDERFNIEKPIRLATSAALEDAVGAAVLRFAKERFEARLPEDADILDELEYDLDEEDVDFSDPPSPPSIDGAVSETSRSRSRSKSRSRKRSIKPKDENRSLGNADIPMDTDSDGPEVDVQSRTSHGKPGDIVPVVATDDQLSYHLMRPAVRSILEKLDATLMVLHNSRDAAVGYLSDSTDDSDASETVETPGRSRSKESAPPVKKRRGRPPKANLAVRLRTPPPPARDNVSTGASRQESGPPGNSETASTVQETTEKKKRGRPRKVYPRLEGETDQEWHIRVAKLRKERTPFFKDDLDSDGPKSSNSEAQATTTGHRTKRRTGKSREASPGDSEERQAGRRSNAWRLGLRDWKDILGAAALAGFPQAAVDRAARRCADLFGQSMEMRTMMEGPVAHAGHDRIVQYHPGMIPDITPDSEGEDDSSDEKRSQTQRHIRSSSVAPEDSRGRSRSRSQSRGRTRSRSASVACSHFCRVRGCSREADGFSRKSNLLRHMKLVHNMEDQDIATDVDSEDEMHGAVHVDGFLKPIKIRRGWRGADEVRADSSSKRRPTARHRRARSGSAVDAGDGGGSDVVMADD
ncbi:uncharacterized protein JN550_004153 [Neoarthrinium moseri]|uniref:uncharacterized protein n=1 Tax=Neoarthrinium moseri TaxID=1658444 RepID=UPI001FDB6A41|nr:uncharacterized protein JN550_004153 [Neoarthrinium moseri]KAI1871950.1 hypothetical protein JN550_004153 [Neoarthrinium moseri]